MNIQDLIYGKNQLDRITNIEVNQDLIEVFRLQEDGTTTSEFFPNKFWILSSEPLFKGWTRLKGDLYYKWGKQFTTREEFTKVRHMFKDREIFSIWNQKEAAQIKDGLTYHKNLSPKDIPVLSFDIETTGLDPTLDSAKLLLISNTFRNKDKITKKLFAYDDYQSEAEMIQDWTKWVRTVNPSIILGHNINSFDFPYINTIAEKYGITVDLGRDDSALKFDNYESDFRVDGSRDLHYKRVSCYGREIIDTMFLAIKYDVVDKKYESYGLKKIIAAEGLEKKDRIFYDASQIRHNYTNPIEWQKIKEYCKDDADDGLALFDLFCAPSFYLAQSVPKPFQLITESATGSQINSMMIRSYLQEGHSLPKADSVQHFEGALSLGVPGIYKNCVKWDVSSLYPSIIRQYKICNNIKDPKMNFLKLVEYFTIERLKNKNLAKETKIQYYKDLEQAQKIVCNSFYGMLGAPGLLFNSINSAEEITKRGRDILKQSIIWATGKDYDYWSEKTII